MGGHWSGPGRSGRESPILHGLQPAAVLGPVVRDRRRALGVSQEALAERAGLDRTYVSGVERGVRNPTVQALFRLAVGLGWGPGDLVGAVAARMAEEDPWYGEAVRRGAVGAGGP